MIAVELLDLIADDDPRCTQGCAQTQPRCAPRCGPSAPQDECASVDTVPAVDLIRSWNVALPPPRDDPRYVAVYHRLLDRRTLHPAVAAVYADHLIRTNMPRKDIA